MTGGGPGDDRLDGKVVAQRALERRMALCHRHPRRLDRPPGRRERRRIPPVPDEDVVEPLGVGVRRVRVDRHVLASLEAPALLLGPAPRVERAVARRAVFDEIELGRGDGAVARALRGVDGRSERGVRMQGLPDVADGGVRGDELVREGRGQHVEVAQADDEVAPLGGAAHQLGDLPRLGGAVADVGIVGLLFVRGMEMRAEDLGDVLVPRPQTDARTRDPFPNVPVAPEEGRGPPVQRVRVHAALLDGPLGQDGQPAAEDAAEVELAVGQDVPGAAADGAVVLLRPALLQPDDLGRVVGGRELVGDFRQSFVAVLGEELEAPAVEGEDADAGGRGVVGHGCVVTDGSSRGRCSRIEDRQKRKRD